MNVENTQVQMRKGILEFCILHIISRGEVYASDMLEELTSARIMVVEGTLYPLLTRLKNAGLVEYKWVESLSGPPRKYYILTQVGRDFLSDLQITWEDLVSSTQLITQKAKTNGISMVKTAIVVESQTLAKDEGTIIPPPPTSEESSNPTSPNKENS
ncbi:MAG: PadR family transcriptional regulator [Bacteroidota bacterium]